MKNNNGKYFIQNTLYSTANMMITGSVIQGFLLESGVSEAVVTTYLSLVQIIYLTEVGAIAIKSEVPLNFWRLLVIFLERTIIAIPLLVLLANVFV